MSLALSPHDIVRSGLCIGCGACVSQSGGAARMAFDKFGQLKPSSAGDWYRASNPLVNKTCPFSPDALNEDQLAERLFSSAPISDERIGRYQTAYVGYASESDFRAEGSSGGMVTWVAAELFRQGRVDGVAHVTAVNDAQGEGRFFKYTLSRNLNDIKNGAKSRYYPIEMSEILDEIKRVPGRYAVVGIPCFIKAVQLLRRENPVLKERIAFTLGLFCGHMKSARFVESFAWQMGVPTDKIARVEFRWKDPARPANWYNARLTMADGSVVDRDWWHLADGDWGAGFFQSSACNYCDDVVAETADVSFGDAWVEPYSSDGNGTNVVVVRSPSIQYFIDTAIDEGRLRLKPVSADLVAETQAAGFRQRREGLAYRLSWHKKGIKPIKRVAPYSGDLPRNRKFVYRIRHLISKWSHRMFYISKTLHTPQIYITWASSSAAIYHGLAYSRGKIGKLASWLRIN